MGMSAGYYLAKQGARTLLLDAFDPTHLSGSHNGETRLMRMRIKATLSIPKPFSLSRFTDK
jgi:glycine/D-amino acid oxidase-like deaminating enzyme